MRRSRSGRRTLYAFVLFPEFAAAGSEALESASSSSAAATGSMGMSKSVPPEQQPSSVKSKSPKKFFGFGKSSSSSSSSSTAGGGSSDSNTRGKLPAVLSTDSLDCDDSVDRRRMSRLGGMAAGGTIDGDGSCRLFARRVVVFRTYKEWTAELPIRESPVKPANYARLSDIEQRRFDLEHSYNELIKIGTKGKNCLILHIFNSFVYSFIRSFAHSFIFPFLVTIFFCHD